MRGGDLHWIWSPYALYQEVDLVCHGWLYSPSMKLIRSQVYGIRALENNEGFTNAQSESTAHNYIKPLVNMYRKAFSTLLKLPSMYEKIYVIYFF